MLYQKTKNLWHINFISVCHGYDITIKIWVKVYAVTGNLTSSGPWICLISKLSKPTKLLGRNNRH